MNIKITKHIISEVVRFIEIDGTELELEPFMGTLFILNNLNVEAGEVAYIDDQLISSILYSNGFIGEIKGGFIPSLSFKDFYNDILDHVNKLEWRYSN